MAKAGLLEQNRLSGANRNTLIAGGIMANTAEIFNFPVPDAAQKEPRVADLDDGYTRIANELLEAVMLAGLTQHQLLVFLAVMRKTYGFNKKLDWVSNEQLSELTGILPHKCSAAKSVLVKRGIFIQSGRNTGINNVVSEWSTLPESGKKNKVYLKEVNLPESGKKSLPKSGKGVYPNQVNTKDKLTKDNIKPFSSENSGESSDQPENDLPVVKPDAAIQSGSKWGTAEDLTAAEWMFDMVKTIAPSARKPNFAGWANDIRLMRERDGRNHRDMCVLFRWACQDNFWSGNVLSPAKLRDKWTQLEINRNKQQAGVTAGKPKLDLTNFDCEQMRRIANNMPEQYDEKPQVQQVAQIINGVFSQLLATFPASLANRDQNELNEIRRQWVLAFRENGITTMEQVNAGMRVARRQNRPFLPSPGQFVAWCREEASVNAGLPNVSELVDMVYEYCRKRGLYPDAESYPWKSNAHYWLVTNLYQNMRANALTDAELRRKAADELTCMTARINRGEAIPEPVKQLPVMGGRPLNRAQALAKIAEIKAKFGLKGASV